MKLSENRVQHFDYVKKSLKAPVIFKLVYFKGGGTDFQILVHSTVCHSTQDALGQYQEPGTPPSGPTWVAGTHTCASSSAAFPKHVSRQLDVKWSNWKFNLCLCSILGTGLPAESQHGVISKCLMVRVLKKYKIYICV